MIQGGEAMDNKQGRITLLMIPKRNPKVYWEKKEKLITLIIERNRKIDKILNKVLKKSINTKINLDELGSFVWENCDGKTSIQEISKRLKQRFGDKADPRMSRLITYIKILLSNKFIKVE